MQHIRWLTTAYGITGEQRFRDGALLGASWMHGTNPQGRPYTTGIGATPLTSLLHLPSRQHDEPVPGITIYGNVGAVAHAAATRVYGLFQPTRPDYDGMALSQLPPPFDNDAISTEGEVKEILQATVPYWRRLHLLQSQNVPVTEFTMWETVSNAVVRSQSMFTAGDFVLLLIQHSRFCLVCVSSLACRDVCRR